MDSLAKLSRRGLVRLGVVSAGISPFPSLHVCRGQDAGAEAGTAGRRRRPSGKELFPARTCRAAGSWKSA